MTDQFRVTLVACVAGNPHKAWHSRLPADAPRNDDPLAPDREPPDDVWEDQTHDFGADLDSAKAFIRTLPEATTTHVVLEHSADGGDWAPIFVQDADSDHLDNAGPGVDMPHTIDSPLPFEDDSEFPEAPPLMPSQGGQS